MKKSKLLLSLLVAMMLILSACSGGNENAKSNQEAQDVSKETKAVEGGTIIVRHFGDPMSWNPNSLPDDNGYPIFQNIFNRLVKLDASKQIIPDLAKSWEVSEDGKTITFHLQENAKWHDGKPVTAEDVKYTFDYIKEQPTYFMNVRFQNVQMLAKDEHTFVMELPEADVAIIADLGWYNSFILPKHIFDIGKPWEENEATISSPIGSGPFKLASYEQGQRIVIERNEDYFAGAPKLEKVVYSFIPDNATAVQALLNGEIDVFENVPAANVGEIEANQNIRILANPYPSPMRIVFNMDNDLVKDVAVRKAIATAIDKNEISEKIYAGIQKPEYTMYPALIDWVANKENPSPSFNIDEAVKILEDAGYTKNDKGYYVSGLVIEVFEGGGYPDAAKLMANTLAKAGIEMTINVSEFNAWAEKVGGKGDFIMELQGGFMGPDPQALKLRYGTGSDNNWGKYSNPEFDKLTSEAVKTADKAKRAELYKQAQKILSEELPFIPVVEFAGSDANSKKFTNLPIDGTGKWGWAEFTYTELVSQ